MGLALLAGGTIGSGFAVFLFGVLKRMGQIDFVIQASYILLLGGIGALMLNESVRPSGHAGGELLCLGTSLASTPGFTISRSRCVFASRVSISASFRFTLGAMVGVMTAILGTGGAFILIPAKIYILRMRTTLAVGTSQFQMFMVACITTVLHSATDHTVDAILGFMLVVGGAIGAHYGSRLGAKLRGEELRAAPALLILVIAIRIAVGLLLPPDHIYSIQSALPKHFSWA